MSNKKRLVQKDNWLQTAGKTSLVEFLGDKVAELNKEGIEMNLLQKDEVETVETNTTELVEKVDTSVAPPEVETVVKETVVVTAPEFLTKEQVADAFVELLKPVLDSVELLTKAADKVTKLEEKIAAMTEELAALKTQLKEEKAMNKETVDVNVPVASLTSLVKERLFAQFNGAINPFSNSSAVVNKEDNLVKSKPAVKVETDQPKHQLAGLVEGF